MFSPQVAGFDRVFGTGFPVSSYGFVDEVPSMAEVMEESFGVGVGGEEVFFLVLDWFVAGWSFHDGSSECFFLKRTEQIHLSHNHLGL